MLEMHLIQRWAVCWHSNAVKQFNASAVRHSLHTCQVGGRWLSCPLTDTGVQGQDKGNLAPSSRLAWPCTFICQQPNHKNTNIAILEMFMAQIQSERFLKATKEGAKAILQGAAG